MYKTLVLAIDDLACNVQFRRKAAWWRDRGASRDGSGERRSVTSQWRKVTFRICRSVLPICSQVAVQNSQRHHNDQQTRKRRNSYGPTALTWQSSKESSVNHQSIDMHLYSASYIRTDGGTHQCKNVPFLYFE